MESEEYQDVLNSSMLGVLIVTTLFFGLVNPKFIDFVLPPSKHGHGHGHGEEHKHEHGNDSGIENNIEKITKELTGEPGIHGNH